MNIIQYVSTDKVVTFLCKKLGANMATNAMNTNKLTLSTKSLIIFDVFWFIQI